MGPSGSQEEAGRYVILVVDTQKKELYRSAFRHFKECDVVTKESSHEARNFFSNNRVDIAVLCDLPQESCLSLLQFFKERKPLAHVIIAAGSGSEEFAVAAFRLGVKDYFRTPGEIKDLVKKIRCLLNIEEVMQRRKSDHGLDNFRSAVNFISEHYNNRLELACVAHIAGMSTSCFQRTFKKKMGVTFTAYVNDLRINSAKKLLHNQNLSISEIAFRNGFSNPYHFTRTFRKVTSTSPRNYRSSLK